MTLLSLQHKRKQSVEGDMLILSSSKILSSIAPHLYGSYTRQRYRSWFYDTLLVMRFGSFSVL